MLYKRKYGIGETFETNRHGVFEIISFEPNGKYQIKFLNTGTTKIVITSEINTRKIKDKNNPFVYSKGYIGDWTLPTLPRRHPLYNRWKSILSRCYNPKSKDYRFYGLKGVYVSDNLCNFTIFVDFVSKLDNYERLLQDPKEWVLDKDIKSVSLKEKHYSEDTVIIVSAKTNNSFRNS